jgi:transcriptional regulator with XRE-family HTH domain
LLSSARRQAGLTQHALANRVGTSQSAIAKLEQGGTNPTLDTLERCANACGFTVRFELIPLPEADPVVERYKQDVDRSLLRENIRKSVDERLRTLSEWQRASKALQQATRTARKST